MLKISIFMVYLVSQDKGILGISKFSLYKQRTEQKRHPTTESTADNTGPPFLDVNWDGHPHLPEEVNDAEILKEILEKVAEYKRYEYCPYGKDMEDCTSKSVNQIVDQIIDVVLHPTEPPTEPPTRPPVTSEAPGPQNEDEIEEPDNEEETESEGTEGEGEAASTTEGTAEGDETDADEDPQEDEEEPTEAPAEEPAEE